MPFFIFNLAKPLHSQDRRKQILQFSQGVGKFMQRPGHAGISGAGPDGLRHLRGLEIRLEGDRQHSLGFVARATPEERPAFIVDQSSDRIGEEPAFRWRIGLVRASDRINMQHPAGAQHPDAVADLAGNPRQFFRTWSPPCLDR